MKKFKLLVLLVICVSCLTVSFAASDDANTTVSANHHQVTKVSDVSSAQKLVKSDSQIETTNDNNKNIDDSDKTLVKNATKTSTNHTYVRPKAYVQLNASVMDDNSEVVNEGQVFFKINDEILKDANNTTYLADVKNGFAQLNYYVGLVPTADYNLTAVYNGSSNYNVSSSDSILTVCKNKTAMDIVINPESVVSGKKMNLTAVFTREDNVTVTGGKVAFKLNHITIKDKKGNPIYARLVDGKASIETSIPVGTSAKTYIISATYSGTTENEETRSKDYQFNVLKDTPNIVLSQENYTVERGELLTINGQILTSDNRTTKRDHKVAVKLNNNTKLQFLASSSVLNFSLNTDDLTNSEYNLTIIIGENGAFKEKRVETKLFVNHYYDELININEIIKTNDKHIVLDIDNSTYEIKDLINKQPINKTFDGTLVVIENDTVKVKFNDIKKHDVNVDHYDEVYDMTNITVNNTVDGNTIYTDLIELYFDGERFDITNCFERDDETVYIGEGQFFSSGANGIISRWTTHPLIVHSKHKILRFNYQDDKPHNITIYRHFWTEPYAEDLDNPEPFDRINKKTILLEFIGNKSS